MRDIRKFYLQNAAGARIDLNGVEGIYATDPSGLGEELSPTYGNLTRGFFSVLADAAEPQNPVGLTINFTRRATAYAQYQDLARWIAAAGDGLLLLYTPYGTTVYYRRVRLKSLKKTERNGVGWLACPAAFTPLSPWYRPTAVQATMGAEDANAMRYDSNFRYDQARYFGSHSPTYSALNQPAGDIPGSIELSFVGTATNPAITLNGLETGTVYGRCAIAQSILSGDELQYSSSPRDSYCRILRSGSLISLDNALDPSTDPFISVPLGEPCVLTMSGTAIDGTAQLKINYYYRTI